MRLPTSGCRSRTISILALALASTAAFAAALPAQERDRGTVTLERIYDDFEFFPFRFGPSRWLEDGAAYTTLEPSESGLPGQDIVRYDAATGRRQVLVSAARLIPRGGGRPLQIEEYEWSPDGSRLLVFTNTRRVWRYDTRGDYWVLDLEGGSLRQLGREQPEASLMYAKFDPAGERVGYVSLHDLYAEDLSTGEVARLTSNGSWTTINGTFDWVYEEEFWVPQPADGWRWSPDGERIAYWQLDAEGVGEFLMINNTDSVYSYAVPVQYPKVGTQNAAARVGVIGSRGGETVWCDVPGDPRENYIPRMEWAGGSAEIAIQHMNRPQNRNDVLLCEAATGATRPMFSETDPAYLEVVDSWEWLPDGRLLWESERTGWRHLYLVTREGHLDAVTRAQGWEIVSSGVDGAGVLRVDADGGWVYYLASPETATQKYLYRTRLDGTGEPERLTPGDQPGIHTYDIAPGARYAIRTWSSFGTPPVTDLVSLPDHRVLRTLVENAGLRERVEALDRGDVEFFQVDIGETRLDAWMMFPPDFDPARKYPLLFYAYSEPWSQTVLDEWDVLYYAWHLMLTQQGYLVASVDNRGTPGPRGRDWRKALHRQLGRLNSADQAAAARKISKRPYVDAARIGIWGWSGGGVAALNALFRYPDVYGTGLAVAAVSDLKTYDTVYQERYMGLLPENEEDYRLGSPVTFASGLEGNLLIVHGTGDDNVHYQNVELLINELVRHNKHFQVLPYPNRTHDIFEERGDWLHLFTELTLFLHEHMPPGDVGP